MKRRIVVGLLPLMVLIVLVVVFLPYILATISGFLVPADQQQALDRWVAAQTYVNPPSVRDDFDNLDNETWVASLINGAGVSGEFPASHAGAAWITDGQIVLTVQHDPVFDQERADDGQGKPAPSQYNNVYRRGMVGFYPTSQENIVTEYAMQISPNFYGSTGLYVECENTFDQTGNVLMPFWSFGFAYLGDVSTEPFAGLNFTVIIDNQYHYVAPVDAEIDPFAVNTYKTVWSWSEVGPHQVVEYYVNGQKLGSVPMPPICVSEVQIWADNYWIPWPGFAILYTNIPEGEREWVKFDYVSQKTVVK